MPSFRGSSQPMDGTQRSPTLQANSLQSEPPGKPTPRPMSRTHIAMEMVVGRITIRLVAQKDPCEFLEIIPHPSLQRQHLAQFQEYSRPWRDRGQNNKKKHAGQESPSQQEGSGVKDPGGSGIPGLQRLSLVPPPPPGVPAGARLWPCWRCSVPLWSCWPMPRPTRSSSRWAPTRRSRSATCTPR